MTRHLNRFFIALLIFSVFEIATFQHRFLSLPSFIFPSSLALADDDDDEDDEEEEEYSDKETRNSSAKTILVPQTPITVTTWKQVTKQIPVDGYDTDSDDDGLVDALDPHPTIPEQRFFTDTDGDGVPDSNDQFPGKDDFFTFSDTADTNINGILDVYEANSIQ